MPSLRPPPHNLTPSPSPDSPVHPARNALAPVSSFVLMDSPIGCRASRYQREAPKTRHRDALHFCEVEGCNIDRSKGFTTRGSLQRHMKDKHSNREPVVCNTCQKRFADSTSLPRHIAKLHPEVPLPTKRLKSKKGTKARAR
ncbi:hypothetical protein CYLTODRAFT_36675 [Cylindrobasidium torrendii FP15055 ss-10]|uniref:C2H2-type domain-containing protein n=1 Tax=Cylindrobasidium torrendii FP15055 ss-10 TaxID=1314674 RepID=A0A0D7BQJ6_9AGAR|nr:hypothetical protein CYLTODRAFT_36675 [Cylindrobasidium torrendii FP15055 ss-10]